MSALAEFQREFSAALLQPDHMVRRRLGEGFAVYQNTVVKGLIDVLRANYPTVARIAGAEWFDAAAQWFARERLPEQPALALYGATFPEFIAGIDSARELPYLPEVARLDRLWTEVHFAADASLLRPSVLQALAPAELQTRRLRMHPAMRFAWLPHSAVTIWEHNRPPAVTPAELQVDGCEQGALLTRPDGAIRTTPLLHPDYWFLRRLADGMPLGEAAVSVLERYPDADIAGLLAKFIAVGVFAAD